jgi:hypothetical protein
VFHSDSDGGGGEGLRPAPSAAALSSDDGLLRYASSAPAAAPGPVLHAGLQQQQQQRQVQPGQPYGGMSLSVQPLPLAPLSAAGVVVVAGADAAGTSASLNRFASDGPSSPAAEGSGGGVVVATAATAAAAAAPMVAVAADGAGWWVVRLRLDAVTGTAIGLVALLAVLGGVYVYKLTTQVTQAV